MRQKNLKDENRKFANPIAAQNMLLLRKQNPDV